MALFNRQKSSDIPPELQPYYEAPVPQAGGNAVRWIVRTVIILIVLFLLFLLVRWAWHEAHTTSSPKVSSPAQQAQKPSGTSSAPTNQPSAGSPGSSSSSNAPGTGSSRGTASTPPATQPQGSGTASNGTASSRTSTSSAGLSNTGPGDTVALFAITTVAAATMYQWRLRRRAE